MKRKEQEQFVVKRTDKLILIIDSEPGKNISHELVRVDHTRQLKYFHKFLDNFISNKRKIKEIIVTLKYGLSFAKKGDYFSSFRTDDKHSSIDFCEYAEKGRLFIFMVITHKKKPRNWCNEDYFE